MIQKYREYFYINADFKKKKKKKNLFIITVFLLTGALLSVIKIIMFMLAQKMTLHKDYPQSI